MALTYQQAKLVKDTVPALREHGEQIATRFYRNMLRDNPDLQNYFNSANQRNGRQPRALASIVLSFASNINNISELIPRLERMCNKHCSLGIRPEHYEVVGKYLLAAFGEVLGPAMTPAVLAAWEKAYWVLAKMLIGREAQLYNNFETWPGWRKFKVDRVVPESDDVYSFYVVPQDGRKLPKFLPGQYVSLRMSTPDGYLQARQYSLSEAWREDYYRLSVKRDEGARFANSVSSSFLHPGLMSNMLIDRLAAGSTVELSHPAGDFFLDVNNTSTLPIVLISAGVGVTPMVAIANTIAKTQPGRPVAWVHGSRRSVPFEAHVAQLKRQNPNFRTHIFKSQPTRTDLAGVTYDYYSRIDLAKLDPQDLYFHNSGTEYYVCGPEQFMLETSEFLTARGVGPARVKFELFATGDGALRRK